MKLNLPAATLPSSPPVVASRYWAFVACHLPVVDTRVALIAQAIFVAVYVHGVACFGAEQIFYDEVIGACSLSLSGMKLRSLRSLARSPSTRPTR